MQAKNRRTLCSSTIGLCVAVMLALVMPPSRAAEDDVQLVRLRASMHFDSEGQARLVEIREINDEIPAGFSEAIKERLLRVKIEPARLGDQAVDWRTGALIALEIQRLPDGSGQLKIQQLRFVPLLTSRRVLALPKVLARSSPFKHEFVILCDIDTQGRCAPSLDAPVPMPEPVRKWAIDSAKTWRFEPQELAGQPQPGQARFPMRLTTAFGETGQRPIDFRVVDPFYRMRSSRE